jgi:hypothetical protein
MNHCDMSSTLNLLLPDAHTSPGTNKTRTLEKGAAQIFVRGSAAISALLAALIAIFVAADAGIYRGVVPLALTYSFAYAFIAYWTWRMSRVAAISALLLYVPMHHSNCGFVHMAVHLSICIVYAVGIASTMLIHQKRRTEMRSTLDIDIASFWRLR